MTKPKDGESYHVELTVMSSAGAVATLEGDLVMTGGVPPPQPDPLVLGPDSLPVGREGQNYSVQLVAEGGVPPYRFAVSDGQLPTGLTLNEETGLISGAPAEAGAAPVALTVTDTQPALDEHVYSMIVASAPAPAEVLRCVEYLGAFRMPNDISAAVTFSYGGLAGRRRADGTLTFFLAIDDQYMPSTIVEVADPRNYSREWQTAPQTTVVQWWSDICQGKKGTWMTTAQHARTLRDAEAQVFTLPIDKRAILLAWIRRLRERTPKSGELTWYEFTPGQAPLGGLLWDEPSQAIYWSYGDFYNVSGRPDWALGGTKLKTDGTVEAHGPWRLTGTDKDNVTRFGSWMSGHLAHLPNGDLLTGSTLQSGNTGSPWGPEAYTGRKVPALSDDPMVDLPMPVRLMRHYPMTGTIDQQGIANGPIIAFRRGVHPPLWEDPKGASPHNINPAHYNGVTSWREVDVTTGLAWIEYEGKRALFFTGINAGSKIQDPTNPKAAHVWYSNVGMGALNCPSHNVPPPVSITGPVSTSNIPVFISYAISDVEKIVRGEIEDYAAEPAEYLDLEDRFGVRIAPENVMSPGFNGGVFDAERGYYFVIAHRADDVTVWGSLTSLVHVFRLG